MGFAEMREESLGGIEMARGTEPERAGAISRGYGAKTR